MKAGSNKKAYVFPNSTKVPEEHLNPYVHNLIESLSAEFQVINADSPTSLGIVDVLKNISKVNWIFFNWIENIPERKGGLIQFILFYIVLIISKIIRIKIVYILHNKISHSKKRFFLKKKIFSSILKHSNYIITHSSEGIRFAVDSFGVSKKKIFFIHHPISNDKEFKATPVKSDPKAYDILIWGTMVEYKGIYEFVSHFKNFSNAERFKVLIAGKFIDHDYFLKVSDICTENIKIENKFHSQEKLNNYMKESRIILFTYSPGSILSSGALMDSLFSPSFIIGPNNGSFADFNKLSLISTYNNFEDLEYLINMVDSEDLEKSLAKRKDFVETNRWNNFSSAFINFVSN